ncbi:MAG: ATP-binding cassette domain-containing protein [Desulfobacteraceae bacterium]|nr:MAG: ATP-binding cassette domain-containing protein [Desulfobacteraceae bacterium]
MPEKRPTEPEQIPVVKRPLLSWVFGENLKFQILLILIIIVMVFVSIIPLEVQKRVVNEAIKMRRIDLLLTYCGVYLLAIVSASVLQFTINSLQVYIGQRTLSRMRKELFDHILSLPINFFRKTQPGTVISSLVTEIATAGDNVGMIFASTVRSVLTLVAFAAYLFYLHPMLAAVSMSIYPIILILVPRLQMRANTANRKRVDATRTMSNKIGESISGIYEIHASGAFNVENHKFAGIVDRLFRIRIVWNLYKFAIKVTNNFFNNLSPFFIFLLGGYFVMNGRLELGSLIAFLSAQKDISDPWKELIANYQGFQDSTTRYKKTMQLFDITQEHLVEDKTREPHKLGASVEVKDLTFKTEDGIKLLSGVNFKLKPGDQMALVGFSGSGKSTLAQCISQLYKYSSGQILIDGNDIAELTKKDMAANIGFVPQAPFIFNGTIQENILYSCVANLKEIDPDKGFEENPDLPSLDDIIAILHQTGLFVDVLRFGMNTMLDPEKDEELASRLVEVRSNFQEEFSEELADIVEFFDDNRYLHHSDVASNITFGTARDPAFLSENLTDNDYFLSFLDDADLTRPLMTLGAEMSRQIVNILGGLPADDVFFEQSPISHDRIKDYKLLVERMAGIRIHDMPKEDGRMLLETALRFIPARHKIVSFPQLLEDLILEGRALFKQRIHKDKPDAFSFYDISEYIYSQTILNNIFFGRSKTDKPRDQERVNKSIVRLLVEEDLLETILEIGSEFEVGDKGDNLSGGQKQKLAIARTLLKRPDILILDEATSALDNNSQARIQNLLETSWKGKSTIIAVVHRLDIIKNYDYIAVLKAGEIVEMGSYDELIKRKGMLYELEFGQG